MKRLLALALALLLLTGCRVDPAMPETTEPKETTAPTAPASRVEALRPGVVSYPLPEGDWFGIAALGESILLMGTGENTPLCLLDGETGAPAAETRLDFTLGGPACLQVMDRGVACYQEAGRRLVLLDEGLRQVAEATLPDTMVGMPQIAPDGRTVFFCAPGEIRGMDLGTGISRLIKKQPSQYLELMGVLFDGTVLACRVVEEDGEKYVGFLSAEDGAALGKDPALESIESLGDAYLLRRTDGIVPQLVYGWREGDSGCLSQKGRGGLIPALPMGGGVELSWKDGALALTLYDFASGRCRGRPGSPVWRLRRRRPRQRSGCGS